ncbi:phosphoesterase family-domain-containing protein [Yarrowia lipolytica]|uniref:acid phosphatase n=1 Tax=Yarrowia lipolytica TaxID=4952 RepID=A0A371C0I2_YARLL|nr:phosphoesterase family-domain-containing protein [Yarrowia lipolytica]RDW30512.1 phosphoesterase family-domain-containing protein [Yarrowia lipolytica]RDW39591.1 phosphoesterase family-domain-containing protein [Yarrowia lipolytica]RDW49387.1 phosphoesterase family-domain-containing protein [Yarrowia lipolytica]RDW55611.1 phosphoesterase family-domain-containing protein [Yarrowia lipolytica]
MKLSLPTLAALVAAVLAKDKNTYQPKFSTISPDLTEIEAAAATAVSNHYTSPKVPGCFFDNYYQIWLENTDYEKAFEQEDLAWLRTQGITLDNYWSLTHPSEPNYVGVVGGDYFGINNDDFFRVPSNVSTVVDLLESKGISWSEYQEHLPYTGFEGFNFSRQTDYAKDYVRKHNPLVIYDSVVENESRLRNIKNFTEFDRDLKAKELPQWTFITPNMTNDAHDTDIDWAGRWVARWLKPLLSNEEFMKNSLVILTFDENHTKPLENKVLAILFGGAVPDHLKGTTDSTYYSHYSNIATVQANWGLDHLGRFDTVANPFKLVADSLNISIVDHDTTGQYNNKSVVGYFNDERVSIPAPNASAIGLVGNTIFPPIAKLWGTEGDIPNIIKPAAGQCGKVVEDVQKPTNVTQEKPSNATNQEVIKSTESSKAGFNSTASVVNVVPVVHQTTTIEGAYVTVYTSDCLTTSVDETGKTVTTHVLKTVTSTVCHKCEHNYVSSVAASSAPASSASASAPVPSTTPAESSKPVESPKPAPVVPSKAPVESPAAESPKATPSASKASSPAGSAVPGTPIVPVVQPSQAQQSTPAVAQANGADKATLGALALLPLLSLF